MCKAEAHRALELLEDYYSRLDDSDEKELKESTVDTHLNSAPFTGRDSGLICGEEGEVVSSI